MKQLITLVFAMLAVSVFGQTVNKTLISKMDLNPQHILWDGTPIMLMGFTELMSTPIDIPGPTLRFTEGDSVDLTMINMSQSAPHTIHLHGLDVNQANDGVPSLSFEIDHATTGHYYFKAPHPGTYIYHCHVNSPVHVQAGMYGLIFVYPSTQGYTWQGGYAYDNELSWMFSEVDTAWHSNDVIHHPHVPGAIGHEIPDYYPQYFLVNGRSENQIDSSDFTLKMSKGEKLFLRLSNIGNYGNILRFPAGIDAMLISTDGRSIPNPSNTDTLAVLPGERFGLLLTAQVDITDSVSIDYFTLNSGEIQNTQSIPAVVSGNIGIVEWTNGDYLAPNPTTGVVRITRNTATQVEYSVYSSVGKFIRSGSLVGEETTIDFSTLNVGVYILTYPEADRMVTHRILIQ